MKQFLNGLKSLDTLENTEKDLDFILEGFMTSDYANNKERRTKALLLFNLFKKSIHRIKPVLALTFFVL
tara:strand:- start:1500 stop:1706 length:207 start_codon:yes stop_codon:yes gene_type:complete